MFSTSINFELLWIESKYKSLYSKNKFDKVEYGKKIFVVIQVGG